MEFILFLTACIFCLGIGVWLGWHERDKAAQRFEADLGKYLIEHYEKMPILRRVK